MSNKIKISIAIVMVGAIGIAFAVYWVLHLQKVHSTFENYYAFRGCAELLKKTDTYGLCRMASGQIIKLVEYDNRWFLDGDLPWGATMATSTADNHIEYDNSQYGFSFLLPQDWLGYSIVTSTWRGDINDPQGTPSIYGPMISIRNPEWTAKDPYQDIPIMIFTLTQWNSLMRDEFHIGAAPINPSRLGYNADYVFALPARYNYAFPAGFEEVDKIIQSDPLLPLPSSKTMPVNDKTLVCGGIPNGSVQNIAETTRLFINLPKGDYPDKENNLQFKTVSGNATAGWVSNAGPYGEAFESTPECWSYYYEFDGNGEIDLTAKAGTSGTADYFVRFNVGQIK